MAWQLFRALDRDWSDLSRSLLARAALMRWRQDPMLSQFSDLPAIIAALRDPSSGPECTNGILAALAARSGRDDVAARTLLQALLPGLTNIAKRLGRGYVDDELEAEVLTEAIDRIRNYPLERRPHAIAANVTLDVFGAITRRRQRTNDTPFDLDAEAELELELDPSEQVCELVHDALERGKIRSVDAQLLLSVAVGHDTISARAEREGLTYNAMCERWRRARNRLRTAVAA
jgi:hypothetical protein